MTRKTIQAIPVARASSRDYELAALVGDDAVILGWTMADSIDRSDLLGFAVKRTRRDVATGDERDCQWLRNHRRFALCGQPAGDEETTTRSDPLQQFFFLDYAIASGNAYSYSVQAVRGTPTLRYYEAPVSVTVHANAQWPDKPNSLEAATSSAAVTAAPAIVPCPLSRQRHSVVAPGEVAGLVRRMTDAARSAVFLYSSVPLPGAVMDVVREVNSGRLLYGLVPGSDDQLADLRRAHNTVHLSRPVSGQRLEPVAVCEPEAGFTCYTSALVTDPWSRSPRVLLWSDMPGTTPTRSIEARLLSRDKRGAARLAVGIFQAYANGRLPQVGHAGGDGLRRLEPDGRWSNVYFSRHAASHKFRQREIFSGHP